MSCKSLTVLPPIGYGNYFGGFGPKISDVKIMQATKATKPASQKAGQNAKTLGALVLDLK